MNDDSLPSHCDSPASGGRKQRTPVGGGSRNGTVGGVAQYSSTAANGTSAASLQDGKGSVAREYQGDGDAYSPPSPYSLPSTPSPPASPVSLPASASLQSHDPVGHAPLSSGRKRKRRRDHSMETSPPSSVTRLSGSLRSSMTPRSRRRILDVTPMDPEISLDPSDHDDLLNRADRVLERLGDNCYHSLDDFNNPDELNYSPARAGNQKTDDLNSGLSDSDLLNPDLRSSAVSDKRGRQMSHHIHVLSRAPAGPYITVTGSEGDRVFLRLRDHGLGKAAQMRSRLRKGLLTVPFAELKASVEDEVRPRGWYSSLVAVRQIQLI